MRTAVNINGLMLINGGASLSIVIYNVIRLIYHRGNYLNTSGNGNGKTAVTAYTSTGMFATVVGTSDAAGVLPDVGDQVIFMAW